MCYNANPRPTTMSESINVFFAWTMTCIWRNKLGSDVHDHDTLVGRAPSRPETGSVYNANTRGYTARRPVTGCVVPALASGSGGVAGAMAVARSGTDHRPSEVR